MTIAHTLSETRIVCHELLLSGRVQGVGFRPFVYRLAHRYGLVGEVMNHGGQVRIVAQGEQQQVSRFIAALLAEAPAISRPRLKENITVSVSDYHAFHISDSTPDNARHIHVLPDGFTCEACLRELHDPRDRRYAYPFINCTQCGPRYTLTTALPYDRANTSMATFSLCAQCAREYSDVTNRRFHAEPLACPECGPQLDYHHDDSRITDTQQALAAAAEAILAGKIVAIKGIGGYHLCCDALNRDAIDTLRTRKVRPDKPLAVMFPCSGADGLALIRQHVLLDEAQCRFVSDPIRPILLATRRPDSDLPVQIAPGLNDIGVMLPYSPLHHLLLDKIRRPIVATSANISGEPVLTDNTEVEERLVDVTRYFLHHDRPVVRPADDSVYRFIAGQPSPLRVGRGVAPLELSLPFRLPRPLLACGGFMKNTVALAFGDRIIISPHIGDMGTLRSQKVFKQVIADLQSLYQVQAEMLICDKHPNYVTSRWARQQAKPVIDVLHHHAHASCVAGEYPDESRWLVFTWDGVGYGGDGTLWGGETFFGSPGHWQRVASMRPFRLPGSDQCAREPWRTALAVCWETGHDWRECPSDSDLLYSAWQKQINAPLTTAVGRLFDAASALLGFCTTASYEAQAPMLLEANAQNGHATAVSLPLRQATSGLLYTDWQPLVMKLVTGEFAGADAAYAVHASFAQALCDQVSRLREHYGDVAVGLAGGVFQNRLLTEQVIERLHAVGQRVYLPRQIPVNDGGLCFGQVIEAASSLVNQNA